MMTGLSTCRAADAPGTRTQNPEPRTGTQSTEWRPACSDDFLTACVEHELHAAIEPKLLVDVVQVNLDGAVGDLQSLGDLLVAEAGRHHVENIQLASRQQSCYIAHARLASQHC